MSRDLISLTAVFHFLLPSHSAFTPSDSAIRGEILRMSSFLLVENLEDFTSLLNESFRPQPDLGADLASRNLLQFVEVERPRLIVQCNVNTKF